MKAICAVLLLALLAGCAPQLEGAYLNDAGVLAFTLAHGKYYGTSVAASEARPARRHDVAPMPIPFPYKVEGKLLIVEKGKHLAAFEILQNGNLKALQDGPEIVFVRK
jgi:hypothetical protein